MKYLKSFSSFFIKEEYSEQEISKHVQIKTKIIRKFENSECTLTDLWDFDTDDSGVMTFKLSISSGDEKCIYSTLNSIFPTNDININNIENGESYEVTISEKNSTSSRDIKKHEYQKGEPHNKTAVVRNKLKNMVNNKVG